MRSLVFVALVSTASAFHMGGIPVLSRYSEVLSLIAILKFGVESKFGPKCESCFFQCKGSAPVAGSSRSRSACSIKVISDIISVCKVFAFSHDTELFLLEEKV